MTQLIENTLVWNQRAKHITGQYRGYRLSKAVRGASFQFGIGDQIYSVYWTGLVRDQADWDQADPLFRHLDTDQELSARHADWFLSMDDASVLAYAERHGSFNGRSPAEVRADLVAKGRQPWTA